MISLNYVNINYFKKNKFEINIKNLSNLFPNQSKELDVICEGIMKGKDFICDGQEIELKSTNFKEILFSKFRKLASSLRK